AEASAGPYESALSTLIEAAQKNNPQLKAAGFKAQAALQVSKAVRSYDAPQLGVEFFQAPVSSFPNPLKNQMEIDYSLQQMIPFPGKLSAMGRAEEARAAMLTAEQRALELSLTAGIKTGFAELYLTWRKQDINSENLALMRTHAEVARARYGSGKDGAGDVLRADAEMAALLSDSITLRQEENSTAVMINAAIGRPVDTSIPRVVVASIFPVPGFAFATLCTLAVARRPELAAMRSNIDMRVAERVAAQREFLPDFMVKGMYKSMMDAPDDYWSLMLGVTLPIAFWSVQKVSATGEAKRLSGWEAAADMENMRTMVFAQIRDAQGRVEAAQARLDVLVNKAIPVAKEALAAALTSYKNGTSDFLMLIDDQKMYFMAKVDLEMTVMGYRQALAQLEQAVGTNLVDGQSQAKKQESEK
ncbi:MAG: TolC family protein, partial [Fibrobacterota bacterium]